MAVTQDRITRMPISMSDKHYLVHEGKMFTASYSNTDLDIATPQKLLIKIGSKDLHYNADLSGLGGVVTFTVYKSPTITNDGTEIPFYNNNGDSSNTLLTKLYHTPTTTANGTQDGAPRVALGSAQGAARAGTTISSGAERILKANTNYLAIISTNTDNSLWSYVIEAYEEDED